jgi:hypothetical protein
MNERIQELMKEAQVIYDYAPFYGDMDRDPKPLYKLDPEKFAELIVRECAEVSENYAAGSMPLSIAHAIKKHFGVQ